MEPKKIKPSALLRAFSFHACEERSCTFAIHEKQHKNPQHIRKNIAFSEVITHRASRWLNEL